MVQSLLEKKTQSRVITYLRKIQDCFTIRYIGDIAGTPDIISLYKGHWIGFEVKRKRVGVISQIQQIQKENIEKAGGSVFYVDDLKQVKAIMGMYEKKEKKE